MVKILNTDVCPICIQEYSALDRSEDVCVLHLNWFVTTCQTCGKVSFSDCTGFCMKHGQMIAAPLSVGSGDHRAYLRHVGQDY